MITTVVPDGHVWLRITKPHYADPFDTSFAETHGGRWNPPDSWPTLYLNEDLMTVHAQVGHMFGDRGIDPADLDDAAPIELAAATLPRRQRVADAISDEGVAELGLPTTYPSDAVGVLVGHDVTQPIGESVHAADLRGVWCRSAAGRGNELAWFPAATATPTPVWPAALAFASWRHATTLDELVAKQGVASGRDD